MMRKKRKWWIVLEEIHRARGKVEDAKWEELSSLIKGPVHLKESCYWARQYNASVWHQKFLAQMVRDARTLVEWRAVAKNSSTGSDVRKKAVKQIYKMTKDSDSYYRWFELKMLLPEGHSLFPKVKSEIARIGRIKRHRRSKAC